MNNIEVGAPMPKTLGLCADEYKRVNELRLAMQKEVDAVKARETEIQNYILENLSKSDDTGAVGKQYKAVVREKVSYSVKDWPTLHDWIFKNRRFDMLPRSLPAKPAKDYVEENEKLLPGTERVRVPQLSVTKI